MDQAQIGQEILDLLAFIKAKTCHNAIGHPSAHKLFLKNTAQGMGTVQNGDIPKHTALSAAQTLDGVSHKTRFMPFTFTLMEDDLFSLLPIGPQCLVFTLRVVADHRVSRSQYGFGGSVVLLQFDYSSPWKV